MANRMLMHGVLLFCGLAACKPSDTNMNASPSAHIDSVWLVGAGALPAASACVPGDFRMTARDDGEALFNEARQSCGVDGPEVTIPWPVSSPAELPDLQSDGRRLSYRYDMIDRSIHVPGVAQRLSVLRDQLPALEFEADHD